MRLLITNATVVNEGQTQEVDVLIEGDRIAKVAANISADGAQVIDAAGKHLLPGMIDDQVHFREPGMEHKATIKTESAAAVAGGITSFMEMPNVNPPTINRAALEHKYGIAERDSAANYAFYLGATNENIDDIRDIKVGEACGVKVFMGASTGSLLVDDETALHNIFADCPLLIATHCEYSPTIVENMKAAKEKYGDNIPVEQHPYIRSTEACYQSSSFAVGLAKQHDSRLHVLHLTTEKEMELFEPGPIDGKKITAEACVHHLFFSEEDYAERGNLIVCNPAIKKVSDRAALWQALEDDRIDVIATDHAPHTWDEKDAPYGKAPAGLPLVQHALLTMLDHVNAGRFTLEKIVHKVCHAPAECYGVTERGYIREGYFADLVLVDLNKPTLAKHEDALTKVKWTPFDGHTFSSTIDTTIVSGQIAYQNGQVNTDVRGQRLGFRAVR